MLRGLGAPLALPSIRISMNKLDHLIEISRHFGANPDYVIAGGGNTSFKTAETLWVKASGIALADIDEQGFVALSREKLGQMETRAYSPDPLQREEEVKSDLRSAMIGAGGLRPSVETSLHNLIEYPYIVHTHPTLVNAVMCADNAGEEIAERFGSEALYVKYTDPGYTLFKKLQERIAAYHNRHGRDPRIIFLQNHGVFVGAGTTEEVKAVYANIFSRIREGKNLALPDPVAKAYVSPLARDIAGWLAGRNLVSASYTGELIGHFCAGRENFKKISKPFTPDIIVYCKSNYLFLEKGAGSDSIRKALDDFHRVYGCDPKVIVEEGGGLILAEEDESSLRTVLEVFTDMMKISYLSEQFGGPHPMTDEQIRVIDQWEAEHYRRSVARNRGRA